MGVSLMNKFRHNDVLIGYARCRKMRDGRWEDGTRKIVRASNVQLAQTAFRPTETHRLPAGDLCLVELAEVKNEMIAKSVEGCESQDSEGWDVRSSSAVIY